MPPHDPSRPTVVVHVTGALDGRIGTRRWGGVGIGDLYEAVHVRLAGNAWMCGRITMQGYTRGQAEDDQDPRPVPRTDHIALRDAAGYAVALDARGMRPASPACCMPSSGNSAPRVCSSKEEAAPTAAC